MWLLFKKNTNFAGKLKAMKLKAVFTQQTFTCSKLAIEKGVKYVQS